jgi:hypothetical protein
MTEKKKYFYEQLLKYSSLRNSRELLQELEKDINPLEHSLRGMKRIILMKYPHLPEDFI